MKRKWKVTQDNKFNGISDGTSCFYLLRERRLVQLLEQELVTFSEHFSLPPVFHITTFILCMLLTYRYIFCYVLFFGMMFLIIFRLVLF